MTPPSEKLAGSLDALRSLQEHGVVAVRRVVRAGSRRRPAGSDLECRQARLEFAENYRNGAIRLDYLTRHAPFVAGELRRQGRLREDDR